MQQCVRGGRCVDVGGGRGSDFVLQTQPPKTLGAIARRRIQVKVRPEDAAGVQGCRLTALCAAQRPVLQEDSFW